MRNEPMELFFERLVEGEPISRRAALRRMAAAGLVVGSAGSLLAACGVEGTKDGDTTQATSASHPKTAIGTVTFSNWPLYIDKKTGPGRNR